MFEVNERHLVSGKEYLMLRCSKCYKLKIEATCGMQQQKIEHNYLVEPQENEKTKKNTKSKSN